MGAVTPLGNTLVESWNALIDPNTNAKGGMTTLEEALMEHQGLTDEKILERELKMAKTLPCQVAAPVKGLEQQFNASKTARFVQFALKAGSEAVKHAKLDEWISTRSDDSTDDSEEHRIRRERIGVCVGSGMSSVREVANALHTVEAQGLRRLSPHFVPKVLSNSAAGRLSLEYGFQGPNHSASTACAAGSHAIGDAMRCIQFNDADVMLAGGAEACIDPLSMAGFCRLRALSTKFGPEEASRPFDSARDGFVMGEGAAILVLEELEHALNRGAPIFAELSGYGLSGDAFHITAPDEAGRGAERAMRMALEQAGYCGENDLSHVGYINAHATSTPKGDEIEARVINQVFYDGNQTSTNDLYVSSTKGALGHLLGAAGAIEACVTIMSLVDQQIPPTKNLDNAEDCTFEFQHVRKSKAVENMKTAMSNSFGFGGTNASLLFERFEP